MQRLNFTKLIFEYLKIGDIERVTNKNTKPSSPYLCSKYFSGSGPSRLVTPKKKYEGIGTNKVK